MGRLWHIYESKTDWAGILWIPGSAGAHLSRLPLRFLTLLGSSSSPSRPILQSSSGFIGERILRLSRPRISGPQSLTVPRLFSSGFPP